MICLAVVVMMTLCSNVHAQVDPLYKLDQELGVNLNHGKLLRYINDLIHVKNDVTYLSYNDGDLNIRIQIKTDKLDENIDNSFFEVNYRFEGNIKISVSGKDQPSRKVSANLMLISARIKGGDDEGRYMNLGGFVYEVNLQK